MIATSRRLARDLFLLLVILTFVAVNETSAQQTINVPADQPTIQSAINAAANGDILLVSPGTYVENIDFKGKAITVTSASGPANTIIDGSRGDIVVSFVNGETRSSVINGFTIENAGASMYPNNSPSTYFEGIKVGYTAACPFCISNPTITNNIITDNHGYGIVVYFGGAYISGNTVSNTSTQYDPLFDFGCDYDDGSGIAIQGTSNDPSVTTTISDNTIEHNVAHCGGGGIRLYAAGVPTIANNIIRYNESKGAGGGIWMINGNALSIIQNLIYGNVAGTAGGGIYLGNSSSNLFVINNTIAGNAVFLNPLVGTDFVEGSQVAFNGSVSGTAFFNNLVIAGDPYGAVACNPTYQLLSPTPLTITNSDVINFSGPTFAGWCVAPPTIASNTIFLDPQFVSTPNGPLHLRSGSPAIDTGNNSAPNLPALDLAGSPRIQGNAIDMGVYEGASTGNGGSQTDFALSSAPQSLTIRAGQSASMILSVSPVGEFIGTVSFTCSGLPTSVPCSFSPVALAFGGDNAVLTTVLTVDASSATAQSLGHHVRGSRLFLFCAALVWTGLLQCFLLIPRNLEAVGRHHRKMLCVILTLDMALSLGAVSCGGGGSQSRPRPPSMDTFTMVVNGTATGNMVSSGHTLDVTVVITH